MSKITKSVKGFKVFFEQIYRPDQDILDVNHLVLHVYAMSVDDAISKAWNVVNLDKDNYEIVSVESTVGRHMRNRRIEDDMF